MNRTFHGNPGSMHVKLAHYGFGQGGSFDKVFSFFGEHAWTAVMKRLQKLFLGSSI